METTEFPLAPVDDAAFVARCRTVVIEGENLIRSMLARLLATSGRFSLLADFGEVAPAWETCLRLQPQLVIIDIDFAPSESVALIEILVNRHSQTKVLAMSGTSDPALLDRLYQTRVHGYVPRNEPIEILEEAMHEVADGRKYHPAAFVRAHQEHEAGRDHAAATLSEQERNILRLVAAGRTSREIAEEIELSPRSVETYRWRMMRRLGLPNSAALVEFAFRTGISKRPSRWPEIVVQTRFE